MLKLQCLHFNNNKKYEYIVHYNDEYYLYCEDEENYVYTLVRYDKETGIATEILLFENYFEFRMDSYDNTYYILGRVINDLVVYKLNKYTLELVFTFKVRTYDKVIDFFVLKGNVFFYLRTLDFDEIELYLYNEKENSFVKVHDSLLINLINSPILICLEQRNIVVIEEFFIKDIFSYELTSSDNFKNNIYYINLEEMIENILDKKRNLYHNLRSNKGLNYITILGKVDNKVVLFLSSKKESNKVIFYDFLTGLEEKIVNTSQIFLSDMIINNTVYFKATDYDDNEIIYNSNINKLFSWKKNLFKNGFKFCLYVDNRYLIFKNTNADIDTNIYNILDEKTKLTKTFNSKLIIINNDIML